MVLLTMTPGIVRALTSVKEVAPGEVAKLQRQDEPALAAPKEGNPISHSQLIDLSKLLKQYTPTVSESRSQTSDAETKTPTTPIPTTLSSLLQSTRIYTPPPPPAKIQTPEYQRLMSRLRADQEARSYEAMLHPPPTRESFSQRFSRAPAPFSLGSTAPVDTEDDVSYEEVHRQIILIINILISVVCVAVFIWVAARHWTVGKRLGLSMGGSLAVAVAEVGVYGGYVRKVKEAKRREKRKPEIKEIVKSWVLDQGEEKEGVVVGKLGEKEGDSVRFRKGKHR